MLQDFAIGRSATPFDPDARLCVAVEMSLSSWLVAGLLLGVERRLADEIRGYAALVRGGTLSLGDFIDRVWTIMSGRFFMLTLEEVTAARHNEALRVQLVARTRVFHGELDATWRHFFSNTGLNDLEVKVMLSATLCLLRGMGVQTALRDDPDYYRRLLRFWKSVLGEQIAAARHTKTKTKERTR